MVNLKLLSIYAGQNDHQINPVEHNTSLSLSFKVLTKMSSPQLSQEVVSGTLATIASDVDTISVTNDIFAEEEEADDAAGLFGSDEDDEGPQYSAILFKSLFICYLCPARTPKPESKHRNLDDEELGSQDSEDRHSQEVDDPNDYENEATQERAQTILDVGIGRHAIPKPSDGEVRGSIFL